MTLAVIDYGGSNVFNLVRALRNLNANPVVASDPDDAPHADRIILPGVGAFGAAIERVRALGWVDAVRDHVRKERPFLGICVGMQLMFETGEEFGNHDGLGLLEGRVAAIPDAGTDGHSLKRPHIGWKPLIAARPSGWDGTMLDGLPEHVPNYFLHSFAAQPVQPDVTLARVEVAGNSLCAAVELNNLVGFQSHPERSGETGLAILDRFLSR